jgi:5'-3' exonuclease
MNVSKSVNFKFIKQDELISLREIIEGVVLIDLSWVLHRSHYCFSNLTIEIDRKSGEIKENYGFYSCRRIDGDKLIIATGDFYGALKAITDFSRNKPDHAIILCLDSPDPEKKDIIEGYKGNRPDSSHVYEKLFEIVTTSCILPNVYVSYCERKEADDLIFNLSQLLSKYIKVMIYANDKDLYQSLTKENIIMTQKVGVEYGRDHVRFTFGVEPEKVAFLRSICSLDTSDNVRAYPRFPRKLAIDIVKKHNDPDDFLKSNYVAVTPAKQRWVNILRDSPETMLRLYKVHKIQPLSEVPVYKVPTTDRYLKKYKCVSIQKAIRDLLFDRDHSQKIFDKAK